MQKKRWLKDTLFLLAALLLLTPAMAIEQPTDEDIETAVNALTKGS